MLFVCVVLLMVLQVTANISNLEDIPLSKSLGFALDKIFGDSLRDASLNKEYLDQHQKMMRAGQELSEKDDDNEDSKLKRVMVDDSFEMGKGVIKRRRSSFRLHSPASRRRARSQAIRREKLNSQSLRSHIHHSKQINQINLYG